MNNEINFRRDIEYDDENRFGFIYKGIPTNDDIDYDKLNDLLDRFIERKEFHRDMIRSISYLRTIFKDFKEELLIVDYTGIDYTESVRYWNGNLYFYYYENENSLKASYVPVIGLEVSFEEKNNNSIIDYPNIDNTNEQFSKLTQQISRLKNPKNINLDMNSAAIIEIYKLFYNENPDFSAPNINIKIQTMMSILANFGITLDDDYSFSLRGYKMPTSIYLEQTVKNLFPLGEISDTNNLINISNEAKKTIEIVGESIRNLISNSDNKDETLITISKIIYASRYNLSYNSNIQEISEFTNRSEDEVKSSIKLVKHIKSELEKK